MKLLFAILLISISVNIYSSYKVYVLQQKRVVDTENSKLKEREIANFFVKEFVSSPVFIKEDMTTMLESILDSNGEKFQIANGSSQGDSSDFIIFRFSRWECSTCINSEMLKIKQVSSKGIKIIIIVEECSQSDLKRLYVERYNYAQFYSISNVYSKENHSKIIYPVLYNVSKGVCKNYMILNENLRRFSDIFYHFALQ